MTRTQQKLVLIEWVDSHSGNGWRPLDELADAARPVMCRSVGWLVAEQNGTVVLVPHISGDETVRRYGTGDIAIPTKAIVKRTVLRDKTAS